MKRRGPSPVMARKLRVEYSGAIYHVMSRGDRREPIFTDDADRGRFVETLAEACAKTGWRVYACVLMPSHFRLVVETPQPNLVAGMKWLLGKTTGLASGGPAAERVGHPQGQPGGAVTAGAGKSGGE